MVISTSVSCKPQTDTANNGNESSQRKTKIGRGRYKRIPKAQKGKSKKSRDDEEEEEEEESDSLSSASEEEEDTDSEHEETKQVSPNKKTSNRSRLLSNDDHDDDVFVPKKRMSFTSSPSIPSSPMRSRRAAAMTANEVMKSSKSKALDSNSDDSE